MVLRDLNMTDIAAAWYAFIDCDTETWRKNFYCAEKAWANLQLRKRAQLYMQKYFRGVESAANILKAFGFCVNIFPVLNTWNTQSKTP